MPAIITQKPKGDLHDYEFDDAIILSKVDKKENLLNEEKMKTNHC